MFASLYWSILILLLGACIGSFLNVVIFRWPRNLSVRDPKRSFCPACHASIASFDNIPVLSFLWLHGRCRHCRSSISLQYPLVELATALVFLMIYDALFVARQRIGIGELANDWPMLIAHGVFGAGVIVLAVMDLEAYLVDIRVTWIISLVGAFAHIVWTPASSIGPQGWIRPGPDQAGMALAATVGLAIGAWLFLRHPPDPPAKDDASVEEPPETDSSTPEPIGSSTWRWLWLILPTALVIVYLVHLLDQGQQPPLMAPATSLWPDSAALAEAQPPSSPGTWRLLVGGVALFVGLALAASHPHPQEDAEIVEAIESEAPAARRNALWELNLLAPAVLLSAAVAVLFAHVPAARETFDRWLNASPVGPWRPLLGLSTAISGWIIGGAIGWLARILFTLLFGKEALGMGDVHMLAAAGALAGWPVAFIGFFLAAPLSLLAIVFIRIHRQSRAVPYGPWLGLAFFLVAMFQDRVLLYLGVGWMFR